RRRWSQEEPEYQWSPLHRRAPRQLPEPRIQRQAEYLTRWEREGRSSRTPMREAGGPQPTEPVPAGPEPGRTPPHPWGPPPAPPRPGVDESQGNLRARVGRIVRDAGYLHGRGRAGSRVTPQNVSIELPGLEHLAAQVSHHGLGRGELGSGGVGGSRRAEHREV